MPYCDRPRMRVYFVLHEISVLPESGICRYCSIYESVEASVHNLANVDQDINRLSAGQWCSDWKCAGTRTGNVECTRRVDQSG